MRQKALIIGVIFLAALALAAPTSYQVRGKVVYEGKAPIGSWKGENTALSGRVEWDGKVLKGRVCLDLSRWDSKEPLRDSHTRKMFEVERFPQACFSLEGLEGSVPGRAVIRGQMEIHGVSRPLEVPGEIQASGKGYAFTGSFTTRITDWQMTPPSLMGMRVRDEVLVWITLEVLP